MKTVLVLIVLLIAGVAGLLTIKLSQEPVTWDMDPTRMIVPLDRPAVYAAAGDVDERTIDITYRHTDLVGRAARLFLMEGDLDQPLLPENVGNNWCSDDLEEVCPGAMSTYRAIKLYLNGHNRDARTTALVALAGSQPWVYRSPYEHPLLWILAASRHAGDDDNGDLQPLIDAGLIEWPDDARLTLEVMTGAIDAAGTNDPMWAACSTPGCRFFVTEYFDAAGNTAMADVMALAGLDLCDGVRSIPCTALRLLTDETAIVGSP